MPLVDLIVGDLALLGSADRECVIYVGKFRPIAVARLPWRFVAPFMFDDYDVYVFLGASNLFRWTRTDFDIRIISRTDDSEG